MFKTVEEYLQHMKKIRMTIVGLTSQKGQYLNGKTGFFVGRDDPTQKGYHRTHIRIDGENTIFKIKPRNLIPEKYTLKTICAPYQVMTLNEEEEIDQLICQAQKTQKQRNHWELCFRYVGPQVGYCFNCHLFGTACYDYCSNCGWDYFRLLHVGKNKLMQFYKQCISCMERERDLNLAGRCQDCCKKSQQD